MKMMSRPAFVTQLASPSGAQKLRGMHALFDVVMRGTVVVEDATDAFPRLLAAIRHRHDAVCSGGLACAAALLLWHGRLMQSMFPDDVANVAGLAAERVKGDGTRSAALCCIGALSTLPAASVLPAAALEDDHASEAADLSVVEECRDNVRRRAAARRHGTMHMPLLLVVAAVVAAALSVLYAWFFSANDSATAGPTCPMGYKSDGSTAMPANHPPVIATAARVASAVPPWDVLLFSLCGAVFVAAGARKWLRRRRVAAGGRDTAVRQRLSQLPWLSESAAAMEAAETVAAAAAGGSPRRIERAAAAADVAGGARGSGTASASAVFSAGIGAAGAAGAGAGGVAATGVAGAVADAGDTAADDAGAGAAGAGAGTGPGVGDEAEDASVRAVKALGGSVSAEGDMSIPIPSDLLPTLEALLAALEADGNVERARAVAEKVALCRRVTQMASGKQ